MNFKQLILCSALVFCGFATASEQTQTGKKKYDVRISKTEKGFESLFNKPSEIVNKQEIVVVDSKVNGRIFVYHEKKGLYFVKSLYGFPNECQQFKKSEDPEMLLITKNLPESDCEVLSYFANQKLYNNYLGKIYPSVEKKA